MHDDISQTLSMQQRGQLCKVCGAGLSPRDTDCVLGCGQWYYQARRYRQYMRSLRSHLLGDDERGPCPIPAQIEYHARRVRQYRRNLVSRAHRAFRQQYYRQHNWDPRLWVVPTAQED